MASYRAGNIAADAPEVSQRIASSALAALAAITITALPQPAAADEGGVGFWVPGFFASLAAAPQVPGWSLATIYYHTSLSGGADVAFARQIAPGRLNVNFTGNLTANLDAAADLAITIPQYVFAQPVLGGQAAVALLVPAGHGRASVDAALSGTFGLGGPGFTIGGSRTDEVTGFGDLIPQASLRWNSGVHNWMTYVTGNVPVGAYDSTRLVNLGIGHGTIDFGGGYTYFNPQTGHELSGALGFTYNMTNPDTQYQNGIDMHFDWAMSQFLTKQLQIGLVGYAYQQLSCDSGSGDRVGCFESRVLGVGPQIGYVIPMGEHQGYINLKAYKEFDNDHRADGWNLWLTFAISPSPPAPASPSRLITK